VNQGGGQVGSHALSERELARHHGEQITKAEYRVEPLQRLIETALCHPVHISQ
jgi:hypothetical protein